MANIPHYSRQEGPLELRLPGGYSIPWHRATIYLLLLVTVYRLWYATQMELIADESYYWLWSKHLDWSYFSKGPGVAVTIWLGTKLFGDTVFGIRFFSVILSAGTGYCLYRLGRKLFDGQVGFVALVLAALAPLFAIGSILMTIDPLSVFFWTAAALTFWRAKDEKGVAFWLLSGLLIGLGMLSKYTNIVELLCFLLFCATSPGYRKWLTNKNFWLMTLVALACLTPVVIWNKQNGWITLEHLWHRGSLDSKWHFSFKQISNFFGAQWWAYSPFLFIGVLGAAIAGAWRLYTSKLDPRIHFLVVLFWPLFLFYTFLSLNKSAEANWVVPCYISGFILAVYVWRKWVKQSGILRGFAIIGVVVSLVMMVLFQLSVWVQVPVAQKAVNHLMDRSRGWADLAQQVYDLQKEHGATFIITGDYGTSSLISFYHPQRPQTYVVDSRKIKNQYSFWSDYTDGFGGESAIYVTTDLEGDAPAQLRKEFSKVEFLKDSYTVYEGRNIKKFRFYLCQEFGGPQIKADKSNATPEEDPASTKEAEQ